jgi:hypothetical protein
VVKGYAEKQKIDSEGEDVFYYDAVVKIMLTGGRFHKRTFVSKVSNDKV